MSEVQTLVDKFYRKTMNGNPCCAGCDWWEYQAHGLAGDCTKSAPVSGAERADMLGMGSSSLRVKAGHILTKRDHSCGDFVDTYDWGGK